MNPPPQGRAPKQHMAHVPAYGKMSPHTPQTNYGPNSFTPNSSVNPNLQGGSAIIPQYIPIPPQSATNNTTNTYYPPYLDALSPLSNLSSNDIKVLLFRSLKGNFGKYWRYLQQFLRSKLSKTEFDGHLSKILPKEHSMRIYAT